MNKKIFPRLLAWLAALVFLVSPAVAYAAGADRTPMDMTSCQDWPDAPEIASGNAILMEAKTGSILYAKGIDEACFPASITKIMTALLTLENCALDDTVTFSYRATHELEAGSTHIARTEGEQMSVRDCLYALLLASANEVAQALAEHISGTIEDFAELMTQRAEELGCTNTHFSNPSGLNSESHYTTCRDMAIIMRAAVANPDFVEICSTQTYVIPKTNKHDEELPIATKHKLLQNNANHYDGALAGKTGYTTIAGNTLVTYAVRGDMELICVVMKSKSTHYEDTIALLNYGFNNFSMYQLSQAETLDLAGDAEQNIENISQAVIPDDEWMILPRSITFATLDTSLDTSNAGTTDEQGRSLMGTIHYSYKGTELGSALLTTPVPETPVSSSQEETSSVSANASEQDGEEEGFLASVIHKVRSLSVYTFVISHPLVKKYGKLLLIIPAVLIILIIILIVRGRRKRRRRHSYYGYSGRRGRRRRRRRRNNKYRMKL